MTPLTSGDNLRLQDRRKGNPDKGKCVCMGEKFGLVPPAAEKLRSAFDPGGEDETKDADGLDNSFMPVRGGMHSATADDLELCTRQEPDHFGDEYDAHRGVQQRQRHCRPGCGSRFERPGRHRLPGGGHDLHPDGQRGRRHGYENCLDRCRRAAPNARDHRPNGRSPWADLLGFSSRSIRQRLCLDHHRRDDHGGERNGEDHLPSEQRLGVSNGRYKTDHWRISY